MQLIQDIPWLLLITKIHLITALKTKNHMSRNVPSTTTIMLLLELLIPIMLPLKTMLSSELWNTESEMKVLETDSSIILLFILHMLVFIKIKDKISIKTDASSSKNRWIQNSRTMLLQAVKEQVSWALVIFVIQPKNGPEM